ncbi:MAG: pyruvate formate-lyase [Clostridia bacterium]|nr:pyruvate formate-lyase [Clostridia bacterium]
MDNRVRIIYERLLSKEYKKLRRDTSYDFAKEYASVGLSAAKRSGDRLLRLAELERAILFPEDRIGMMRTIKKVPPLLTEKEYDEISADHFIFDGGIVFNIASDYGKTLSEGMEKKRAFISEKLEELSEGDEKRDFYKACLDSVDALYIIAEKYRAEAERSGNTELAQALKVVPKYEPKSYYQALVFLRLLNFTLWLNGNKHITLGRFDQYAYPYFERDIKSGAISYDEAFSLTQEFFISLNFDADLYPGVQQGDNGQSMVLGGVDKNGKSVFNDLSKLCLEASLELKIIDPKINIRVDKNTPDEVYLLGTELTKQGLGFPQYSNDDAVIPALVKWGYDIEDARNYVVAACWEFIIPGVAMDIVNIEALNFPKIVRDTVFSDLKKVKSFDELFERVRENIFVEAEKMVASTKNIYIQPSPFQSLLMTDRIEEGVDISEGAKYNNYGFHGAGLSTATDSLAAVKKCVFEEGSVSAEVLLNALESDFEGYAEVRNRLLKAPKMGNNDDYADGIAVKLLDCFADSLEGKKNDRGGIFRAGTGSAMYYIWSAENLGATPDGREKGSPFAANYSPSLGVKPSGVISVIKSFVKPDLKRVCNGGPLTLEFHDTVFKNDEGTGKVAALVKYFISAGGHQLQLNAVNRDKLLDAQKHPEKYPDLIVRVWGWSGYFNELDAAYQNHIIKRMEFSSQ